MSSNREAAKKRINDDRTRRRTDEKTKHFERKVKKMLSKDKSEKYKRYDTEEDFYSSTD